MGKPHRFKPGDPKPPNSGRRKGTPNRFTSLKQDFLASFEKIGGVEGLTAWARKNRSKFYTIISKMLPSKVEETPDPYNDLEDIAPETLAAIIRRHTRTDCYDNGTEKTNKGGTC